MKTHEHGCIRKLLQEEYVRFPQAEIQDYYKLLFQSVFGGEHQLQDYDHCLEFLRREMLMLNEDKVPPLSYEIGLDTPIVRVNLARCKAESISHVSIAQAFYLGSKSHISQFKEAFQMCVRMLCEILSQPPFGFEKSALERFYTRTESLSFPAVHHSVTYTRVYDPHYRVIPSSIIQDVLERST